MAGLGAHHLNLIHRDDIVAAALAACAAPAAAGNEALNGADDGRAAANAS